MKKTTKQANKQRNKILLLPGPVKYVQLKESKLNKMQIHNQTKVTPRYYLFSRNYLVSPELKIITETSN